MKRGSITVFLALTLVLVLSFLFSLLEGARVHCLKGKAELVTQQCMQSMFGNYHEGLWEDYHLLFLDGSWQEGEFSLEKFVKRAMVEVTENLSYGGETLGAAGWDLTALTPRNVSVEQYQLATDDGGGVFQKQVALQMQLEAAGDVLDQLISLKSQGAGVEEQREQKEDQWEQAWDAVDEAEEIKENQKKEETDTSEQEGEGGQNPMEGGGVPEEGDQGAATGEAGKEDAGQEQENPMDYVKELKSSTMLGLVVPDPSRISGKALQDRDFLEDRNLHKGDWKTSGEAGIVDRLLLHYYIQSYFSDFTRESEKGPKERVLSYELEYLISGKESDSRNLETVVYELLGVREVMNFLTIMQDAGKRSQAFSIATAAVGFTGIMPLIQAVQIGILLAWAFVESVLDLRTLLEGGNVPLMKRPGQWSGNLSDCRGTVESGAKAGADKDGLSYTQYLQILLFLLSERTISYRCMDLIERNEQMRMDHMIHAVGGSITYQARPLFWNLNMLVNNGWDGFLVPVPVTMSYAAGT